MRYAFLLVLLFFSVFSFGFAQVGESAPDFSLLDQEGERVSLADFAGTPTVLNFWATWCLPCVEELPIFQSAKDDLGEEVVFLLVNNSEGAETAVTYLEEHGITVRAGLEPTRRERAELGLDTTADVLRRYGVFGIPTTVFVDAEGTVQEVKSGPLSAADLAERLRNIGVVWEPAR